MKTTITLDKDAFEAVKRYAEARSLTLGKAASELVRRGASYRRATKEISGLRVFDLPSDSPKVTTQLVRRIEGPSRKGGIVGLRAKVRSRVRTTP